MGWDSVRQRLKDMDLSVRSSALTDMVDACASGAVECAPASNLVNLHIHTIFSYSGYGHSPMSLAWLAKEKGWRAVGTVDFDVLDGVDETMTALDRVGVRGAAGLETRVFLPEHANWEFNSPGEPGIIYYVGVGFVSSAPAPAAEATLTDMRERAAQRNREMTARINAFLAPVVADYDRDVLPLTPSGNATERHILVAYDIAARKRFPMRADLLAYWADKLSVDVAVVDGFLGDTPFPHDLIRSKLMKRGGVGYAQPGPNTFPPLDRVNRAIIDCGALPTYAFLDGMSEGEQHLDTLCELLIGKGMAGLTIVPDRNWNIADPEERAAKIAELDATMTLARDMDLPVFIGTEMNKAGQREMDDLEAEPLRPYREDFVDGADMLYGHTLAQRALGRGYQSDWARTHLPDRAGRNGFYVELGRSVSPGSTALRRVRDAAHIEEPQAFLNHLSD